MADNIQILPEREAFAHRHHFATPEQQRETAMVGMWLFLATEIMMFGGLFMAYAVYRLGHPGAFQSGSADMNVLLGSINTALLISSTFTMALAVHAAQEGRLRGLAWLLVATIVIGAVFLGIKFSEYYAHFREHRAPGVWYESKPNEADPGGVEMFFVLYYIMTGLHAIHMLIGIGIMAVLWAMTLVGRFSRVYHNPVVVSALYWGFVDIVWMFLFALFYLPGLRLGR